MMTASHYSTGHWGREMCASAIVFDLETVPDLGGYAVANNLVGQTEEEVREAIGKKFPKRIYHQIVCIGAVVAHFEDERWVVDSIGAPSVKDRTEKELIEAFVNRVAQLRPCLITFNGHAFDLPTLRYRAMINSVSAPGIIARNYFNRYSTDALDLCEVLSSFTNDSKVTLNELSKILGFAGKPSGIDGKQIESYFRAGRIQDISNYCETDVVNTYRVWLRYELFCGRLTKSAYDQSESSLTAFLRLQSSAKPHLLDLLPSMPSMLTEEPPLIDRLELLCRLPRISRPEAIRRLSSSG
jgi:predicted PolB exonuclease-like 3'-5' exonuclease